MNFKQCVQNNVNNGNRVPTTAHARIFVRVTKEVHIHWYVFSLIISFLFFFIFFFLRGIFYFYYYLFCSHVVSRFLSFAVVREGSSGYGMCCNEKLKLCHFVFLFFFLFLYFCFYVWVRVCFSVLSLSVLLFSRVNSTITSQNERCTAHHVNLFLNMRKLFFAS
ncbi:unnamed protein product [Trypanosoma congolense IL3000]|uniref:WGS project CAEQ00000000 data, annotated contig 805 n=1 Tax=Trypanosoma congolense (strain IL3000) TaxID=1068625 RepID=F9WIK1_TRYCI|nr:unnamed protein product [Trypanosoma congolense IL3000]